MNKSEIAERAAREIAKLATGWDYSDVPDLFEEEILKFVERAIAESQPDARREAFQEVENFITKYGRHADIQSFVEKKICESEKKLGDGEPSPPPHTYEQGRLDQFLRMKKERPIDPVYWDMHEENRLRAAVEGL